ncbi:diffusible signal factor-reguated Ax21 faimly protein [Arenimonas fontis]|uniref:Ax21 family protein n=1 Tax=Arenimonas fontis TaxID=2608255 RepID=A0A5B2ZC79_9GAMM|nr:diffusible signal factor-reguated Ax21 faimly protein [Arenimonas fontis]KAA2284742.1 Ax21 family protein [Arenimonas fontis]
MKRSLIALSLAALLPLAAQADDKLSYTYVEGGYINIDNDADGFGVRGSFEFGNSGFYGFGAYSWLETDVGSTDIDASELGFGYAHGLTDNLDLIGEAAWQNVDVDGAGSADGYRASVGLRGSFTENFEGLIKANYVDGDDIDSDFTGTIGAQYKFNKTWGITGEVEFADNAETYLVGLRASF